MDELFDEPDRHRGYAFRNERSIATEDVTTNPTRDVSRFRVGSTGYRTWAPEEVEQYEKRHPVGSKARLALGAFIAYWLATQ